MCTLEKKHSGELLFTQLVRNDVSPDAIT